jgi:carbon storage regulator
MLILTRKLGEVIRVGDDVTVRVLEVRGNQVRLGVEAPPDIRIYREEIYRVVRRNDDGAPVAAAECLDEAAAWQKPHGKT